MPARPRLRGLAADDGLVRGDAAHGHRGAGALDLDGVRQRKERGLTVAIVEERERDGARLLRGGGLGRRAPPRRHEYDRDGHKQGRAGDGRPEGRRQAPGRASSHVVACAGGVLAGSSRARSAVSISMRGVGTPRSRARRAGSAKMASTSIARPSR